MTDKAPYTTGMREMLKLARAEAGRLAHDYIGPEHYLLGILRQGSGIAIQALLNLEIKEDELKFEIERRAVIGKTLTVGLLSPNHDAKHVLEKAKQIAGELNHNWVGTEHLLLALLGHESGAAYAVLRHMGLQYEALLKETLRWLDMKSLASANLVKPEEQAQSPAGEEFKPIIRSTIFPEPPFNGPERGESMIDKTPYTPGMREVLKLSKAEAGRLGNDYIGTEHYLLGLLRKGDGLALQALMNLEVELDDLKMEIERLMQAEGPPTVGLFSPNAEAKQALELAKQTASELKHGWVGSEHLLLGILRTEIGISFKALTSFGVDFAKAKEEVLKVIEGANVDKFLGKREIEKAQALLAGNTVWHVFAPELVEAFARAHHEMVRMRHGVCGSEHLLLAVLQLGGASCERLLTMLASSPGELRAKLLPLIEAQAAYKPQTGSPTHPEILNAEAKRVLGTATWRAGSQWGGMRSRGGNGSVETQHLLLALFTEPETRAMALLRGEFPQMDEAVQHFEAAWRMGWQ